MAAHRDAGAAAGPEGGAASGACAALERFSTPVRDWFGEAFSEPTPAQARAWDAIAAGCNALVIAPTGSGKTLAAFLFAIDRLAREKLAAAEAGEPWRAGVRVLYVSPLKALGADVERNLQRPLAAIAERADALPAITTVQRTGDTTPDERRRIQRNPPDVLITTPESLYLMLTSQAREALRTVQAVIVDEVHALAGSKRGAHLALSLERLDGLLEQPAQRIGLSATVRPAETVARFLGGAQPVQVVQAPGSAALRVQVRVPVEDMTAIPAYGAPGAGGATGVRCEHGGGPRRAPIEEAWKSDRALRAAMGQGASGAAAASPDSRAGSSSLWPHIEAAILDEVLAHRSTIVFVNSRGLCEKLTARLNELYVKRAGLAAAHSETAGWWAEAGSASGGDEGPVAYRSDMGASSLLAEGAPPVVAKAHHGSVSKEKRRAVEQELKRGELPCVVATSSLELGIDMGEVDLVLQVAPPPSVASALQRVGRANHQVGATSEGIMYPRTRTEVIDAAVVAEGMREGAIELTALVANPLDVLAQQTVAAVAMGPLPAGEWLAMVRRAANFADLPRAAFDAVLDMLAGRMASGDLAEFGPRLLWDRSTDVLEPRPGSQRLAVTAAGTIPDRGMFSVVLPEGDGRAGRRRVGELDEEMVMESRVGDIIALGTSTWRIAEITGDRVMVEPAPGRSARLPFWHGEAIGRPSGLGRSRGAFVRQVAAGVGDGGELDAAARERLEGDGLDRRAISNLAALLEAQRQATGTVPTDKQLVVERCQDESGDWRVILHSPYGRRVHEPWALAVADRIQREHGFDPQVMAGDDGLVVRFPLTVETLPGAELFRFDPAEAEAIVRAKIGSTALFATRFRECAARALLMTPTAPGKRAPLWQQRLKAGQLLEAARREDGFPIMVEAARECLQDVFDMAALRQLLGQLEAGQVRMAEVDTTVPSPFAAPLIFGYVTEHLYEGDLPHAERRASLLAVDPGLLGELLGGGDVGALLDPEVVRQVQAQLQHAAAGWQARGAEGAADLLRTLGPLDAAEVAARLEGDVAPDDAEALLRDLEQAHRAFPCAIGGVPRWAAADDGPRLHAVLGVEVPGWVAEGEAGAAPVERGLDGLVARYARTHGPFCAEAAARRLGLGTALVGESLGRLAAEGVVEPISYVADGCGCEEGAVGKGAAEGDGEGAAAEAKGAEGATGARAGAAASAARAWVDSGVLRRLRSRSLDRARQAVEPVPAAAYARFLLDRQALGAGEGMLEGVEGVAEVIAQFEGVFLPAEAWEAEVLPRRVRRYRAGLLDELVASGEVLWLAQRDEPTGGAGHPHSVAEPGYRVAFYPADSPLAPLPAGLAEAPAPSVALEPGQPDAADEAPSVPQALHRLMAEQGPLAFPQMVDGVRGMLAPQDVTSAQVAEALAHLVGRGAAASDSLAFVRAGGIRPARAASSQGIGQQPPAARRRAHSRRSRSAYADAKRQMRQQAAAQVASRMAFDEALGGQWSLRVPDQVPSTVRALALVESMLDRYGLVTRDIALLDGVPGGLSAVYPVLRQMEDAGDLLRGMFVEGLGPAQFAARETVDALRAAAAEGEGDGGCDAAGTGVRASGACEFAVLAADDPASLYGAGLPWPAIAAEAVGGGARADDASLLAAKPSRRAGALVVLADGAPVLYAGLRLKVLLAFTADEGLLAAAVEALAAFVVADAKRRGSGAAREKILVSTVNGAPVLGTPLADLLQQAGFVRQPDGMRLYINPF